jgi:cytochrome c
MGEIMRLLIILSAAAGLMIAGNTGAVEMPDLAKKNNCIACHAIDRKVVGPAWMDVAKKYKGDKSAEARLVAKVKKGGSGVWGSMAMPPQPAVKEEDIRELVKFILALDK